MSVISKRFADELADKEMRDAYLSAQTRTKLAKQIRTIRAEREWSQAEFGKELGKPQSTVSRLEDREYGSFTLQTLLEVASAFDVGLVVKFVPYEAFLLDTADLSPLALEVGEFSSEALEPLTRTQYHRVTSVTLPTPTVDAGHVKRGFKISYTDAAISPVSKLKRVFETMTQTVNASVSDSDIALEVETNA